MRENDILMNWCVARDILVKGCIKQILTHRRAVADSLWRIRICNSFATQKIDPLGLIEMKVIVLVPDIAGGISSLFEQLRRHERSSSRVHFEYFYSHDEKPWSMLRFPWKLVEFAVSIGSSRFSLCHINLASRGSTLRKVIFSWICRAFSLPYIIHLHGAEYPLFFAGLPPIEKRVVQAFFRRAERVIVLGSVWRNYAVSGLGVEPTRVSIVPNAVRGPRTVPLRDETCPRILFLGRLGERKGVPELLDCLASSDMMTLEWTATLAGDGDVTMYRERVHALGLESRIALPGWLGAQDVQELLETSHILVLPSHAENLPLSLLEGMAYGLCPVLTAVGAIEDVIRDDENGVLVPVGDARALTVALTSVIQRPEKRQRLASQARKDYLRLYDIQEYGDRLKCVYERALLGSRTQ